METFQNRMFKYVGTPYDKKLPKKYNFSILNKTQIGKRSKFKK